MEKLYPLRLSGITKSPIWGGVRLLRDWGKCSDAASVGESWELTVREKEQCLVTNGAFRGQSLNALIALHGAALTGDCFDATEFPLLIKLLDANDRLSVQVHPDDEYAARMENDRGKTEMWSIVDAAPDAEIVCGLAQGVTPDAFANAVTHGEIEKCLKHQRVHAGETYFIPAGLPHAIGKGILIAEIQQNCDLTYRVYDYDRRDARGRPRELHIQKAIDVIRSFDDTEIESIRYSHAEKDFDRETLLAHCAFFRVERHRLSQEEVVLPSRKMIHLLCLQGEATIIHGELSYSVGRGDSWLIPAGLDRVSLVGDGTVLLSSTH